MSLPIDFGKTLNIVAFTFGHKEWPHKEWILPADHEELNAAFKGWGQPTQGLVKVHRPYPYQISIQRSPSIAAP